MDVTEESVGLQWEPPDDDGGCEITNYIIEKRLSTKRVWEDAGNTEDTFYTVMGLTDGSKYLFHVAAENEIGVGPFAELKQAITARSPFSK